MSQAPLSFGQDTDALKDELAANIDGRAKLVQEMVDSIFSFAEPGFQEFETSAYITGILAENGFEIEMGISGIPTAWTATWSNGDGPTIALGSDIDALLGLSQLPGSPEIQPMIPGAPGHGEGHNSGMPAMVAAALAVQDLMVEHDIPGKLMLWPGVAEELLATKAYFVRDGIFDDVDANIFSHVGRDLNTSWGTTGGNGMVSVEYTFHGKTAHGAGAPWAGRSALDAVEVMNYAWNMRREHLPLTQRSHYIISNGGGQPNIVPDLASVWYYFREQTFESVRELFETGNTISEAAAMATETTVERRILGYAAPQHGNKPMAEAADIGDIMWTVPTITIRYPSNVPNTTGHHVTSAMAMATPIAHKGAVTGAKAVGMTVLDLLLDPTLIPSAKDYFENVQLKGTTYAPVLSESDMPAIDLNTEIMSQMRPQMREYYYDPSRYDSYLEQLGIDYPPVGQ